MLPELEAALAGDLTVSVSGAGGFESSSFDLSVDSKP